MKGKIINGEMDKRVEINDYVIIDLTEIKSNVSYRYSYQIISEYNLEIKDSYRRLNINSPLGRELLSKKVGDSGFYNVHEYYYKYNIIDIIKNKDQTLDNSNFAEETLPKVKTRKK